VLHTHLTYEFLWIRAQDLRLSYVVSIDFWQYKFEVEVDLDLIICKHKQFLTFSEQRENKKSQQMNYGHNTVLFFNLFLNNGLEKPQGLATKNLTNIMNLELFLKKDKGFDFWNKPPFKLFYMTSQ